MPAQGGMPARRLYTPLHTRLLAWRSRVAVKPLGPNGHAG